MAGKGMPDLILSIEKEGEMELLFLPV